MSGSAWRPPTVPAAVAELCKQHGILLHVDEVINGSAAPASFIPAHRVKPDIVTVARASRAPIADGATVVAAVFQSFVGDPADNRQVNQVNTYGGHPVAAAVAARNIEILLEEKLRALGRERAYLLDALGTLQARHRWIEDVRGKGLYAGVELVTTCDQGRHARRADQEIVERCQSAASSSGARAAAAAWANIIWRRRWSARPEIDRTHRAGSDHPRGVQGSRMTAAQEPSRWEPLGSPSIAQIIVINCTQASPRIRSIGPCRKATRPRSLIRGAARAQGKVASQARRSQRVWRSKLPVPRLTCRVARGYVPRRAAPESSGASRRACTRSDARTRPDQEDEMKAAMFHGPHQPLTIENVDIDKPAGREVLVRVVASGVCHSDLHFVDGLYPFPTPAILGHEAAGIVEAVGRR
jgi:hypothetical protein